MRVLCLHGISKDAWNRYSEKGKWYYQVLESGFKYNLSDIQSSIGIHQLRKLEGFAAARRRLVAVYREELGRMEEVELPEESADGRHAWHLFAIRLRLDKLQIDRAGFMAELQRQGVGASVHFIPLPLHPFFGRWAHLAENYCPRALALYERLISLPLYPALTEEQVREVARRVRQIVARARVARPVLAAVGD
jgi:dTDP-4-amino-4,6-dideoxygalactose transaminase